MSIRDEIKEFLKGRTNKFSYNAVEQSKDEIKKVLYSGPYWSEEETISIIESIMTGKWMSAGENVHKFEHAFSKKYNQKASVMLNSGSSANLILITAMKKYFGWKDGDEIIVSPVGFPTTIAPIVQNNLVPVFIDIEFETLNFDLDKIKEKISNKTRAIFLSPVLGNTVNIDKLMEIINSTGNDSIKLILDSCDSLGSKWKGKYLNEYAFASTFSFYPAHHICTMEGGMVSSNDTEFIKLARSFAWWGRDCFKSDAKIYTKKGIKLIKDIQIGDYVYTHTGNYKKVYDLIQKEYYDDFIKITCYGKEKIICTKTHPLYVLRNGTYQWINASDLKIGDFLLQKVPTDINLINNLNFTYKNNNENVKIKVPLEPDIMRLIGYYAAEGYIGKASKGKNKYNIQSYSVQFSFHKNENKYHEDVIFLMKKYFNTKGNIKYSNKNNGISIFFKSRTAYEFFNKYIGKLSYNKKLPWQFIHLNNDLIKEFIKGYWRGDGSNSDINYSMSTTSETLAEQLKLLLIKFGINSSLTIRYTDNFKIHPNNPKIIAKHNLYNIVIWRPNAIKFGELINEDLVKKSNRKCKNKYFTDDLKYSLHEIKKIDIVYNKKETVYNFEVEDDESYHANGIISHNCYCVGSANLLPHGTCGHRFDKWLDNTDCIIDHKYVFNNIGYNLKPLDLQGAIGLEQLKKVDEIDRLRKEHKNRISKIFKDVLGDLVHIPEEIKGSETSWFGVPIIMKDEIFDGCAMIEAKTNKNSLVSHLEAKGIQTRNYFAGNILLHRGYQYLDDYKNYPNANKVLDEVFFVGCHPSYNEKTFDYIEKVLREWKNV